MMGAIVTNYVPFAIDTNHGAFGTKKASAKYSRADKNFRNGSWELKSKFLKIDDRLSVNSVLTFLPNPD